MFLGDPVKRASFIKKLFSIINFPNSKTFTQTFSKTQQKSNFVNSKKVPYAK
jgi:hypothetical protein